MNTAKIAKAVKNYLVDLAINDKLPLDLTMLSQIDLESVIKLASPSVEEEAVELASHYLSDGDLSTEEMVDAISNHEDPTDLIDNVKGVVVWQQVENTFTCEEFLKLIGLN